MSEELRKRIGDAYLNPTFVDGQVLLHTQLNEIVSVTKAGINENYYDIQRLIKGEYSVGNSEKLNGALLSRYLDTTLQEDDNLVPSSQQVKAYVDKAIEDVQLGSDVGNIMLEVNDLKTKVSANEGSIGNLQTGVSANAIDIDNLEIEVDTLQNEVNDLKENFVIDSLESNSKTKAPSINAVNKALLDYLFYKDGDTYITSKDIAGGGYISTGATTIYFSIFLPKRLDNISSITVNNINITVRGIEGYLLEKIAKADFDGTITAYRNTENSIMFALKQNTVFTSTNNTLLNNTPISFEINSMSLTFNSTDTTSEE